jgi:threonine/homoserine/homoserine lactone efflux protein
MAPFIDGIIAGYGIAIPVGAVAILIVNSSMRAGFRIGFMAGAGAASADFIYAVLASVAGTTAIGLLQPIAPALRVISGLVLVGLAVVAIWNGARSERSSVREARATGPWHTYLQFLGITLINPLTVVYFTALILGQDSSSSMRIADLALFALGAGIASLSWQTLLAMLGGIARNRLSRRFRLWATILGNILVFGLGIRILVSSIA